MKIQISPKEAKATILEWDADGIFDEVTLNAMDNAQLADVLNAFQKDFESADRYEVKDKKK